MTEPHRGQASAGQSEEPFFALEPGHRRTTALVLAGAGLVLAVRGAQVAGPAQFLTFFLGCLATFTLVATIFARRSTGMIYLVVAGVLSLLAFGNMLRDEPESPVSSTPRRPAAVEVPSTSASPSPSATPTPTASPVPERVLEEEELTLAPRQQETPFDGLHVLADEWTGSMILQTRGGSCYFRNLPAQVEKSFVLPGVKENTWFRATVTNVDGRVSHSIRNFTVVVELVRSSAAPAGNLMENC